MDSLVIEAKTNSPLVNFSAATGELKIIGRSIPEHPLKFYTPLENWIADFINTTPKKIILIIYLDYLNTHSTECMLILIKKIDAYQKLNANADVSVSWSFDEYDEDMESLGHDLASIVNIPFTFKEVKEL